MGEWATEHEYRESVKTIAEWIIQEHESYEDRHDAVHEAVDASEWVIYTGRAQKVLEHSGNSDAGPDSLGWEDFVADATGWSELYTRGAYFAMAQDVYEALAEMYEEEE